MEEENLPSVNVTGEVPAAPPEDGVPERKQEDNIQAVIESLLFAYEKPLTIEQIRKVLDNLDAGQIRRSLETLIAEYDASNRGMRIIEVAGGYKMISAPHFAGFLRKLFKGPQNTEKLSGPSMETLAIIAYKQPISKLEIESLRKVNADGVVSTLTEKNLIRVTGRKDAPGRPKVYGTTREFLEYFGLKSLEELPKLDHFPISPDKQREILEKFAEKKEVITNDDSQAPAQKN
jgi:segregation and condensation protein B